MARVRRQHERTSTTRGNRDAKQVRAKKDILKQPQHVSEQVVLIVAEEEFRPQVRAQGLEDGGNRNAPSEKGRTQEPQAGDRHRALQSAAIRGESPITAQILAVTQESLIDDR